MYLIRGKSKKDAVSRTDQLGAHDAALVGQLRGPQEVVLAGDRVDGAHNQLDADLRDSLPGHGYSPVVGAIVYHE